MERLGVFVAVFGVLVASLVAVPAEAATVAAGAGVVVRTTGGGGLLITGDQSSNRVSVAPGELPGEVRLIDGTGAIDLAIPIDTRLRIVLGGGDDVLEVLGLEFAGSLSVAMGAGSDTIRIEASAIDGTVSVNTGSAPSDGRDVVISSGNLFGASVTVRGAAGIQSVCDGLCGTAGSRFAKDLRILTGAGDSEVRIGRQAVVERRLLLSGGSTVDRVYFDGLEVGRNPSFRTQSGNDIVALYDFAWQGRLSGTTGAGDDVVRLGDSESQQVFNVNLGAGDDAIGIGKGHAATSLAHGSGGSDTFCDQSGVRLRSLETADASTCEEPESPALPDFTAPDHLPAEMTCLENQVDINNSSAEEIRGLPGVADLDLAEQVVARSPYLHLADLSAVSGMSDQAVQELVDSGAACVAPPSLPPPSFDVCTADKINVNDPSATIALTGLFGDAIASLIVEAQPFWKLDDLLRIEGIDAAALEDRLPNVCVVPPPIRSEASSYFWIDREGGTAFQAASDGAGYELRIESGVVEETGGWVEITDIEDPEFFGPSADYHIHAEWSGNVWIVTPPDPIGEGVPGLEPTIWHWKGGLNNWGDAEIHTGDDLVVLPDGRWAAAQTSLSISSALWGTSLFSIPSIDLSARSKSLQIVRNLLGRGGVAPSCDPDITDQVLADGSETSTSGTLVADLEPIGLTRGVFHCVTDNQDSTATWSFVPNRSVGFRVSDQGDATIVDWELSGNMLLDIAMWLNNRAAVASDSDLFTGAGSGVGVDLGKGESGSVDLHTNVALTLLWNALEEAASVLPGQAGLYGNLITCPYSLAINIADLVEDKVWETAIALIDAVASCLAGLVESGDLPGDLLDVVGGASGLVDVAAKKIPWVRAIDAGILAGDQILTAFDDGEIDIEWRSEPPPEDWTVRFGSGGDSLASIVPAPEDGVYVGGVTWGGLADDYGPGVRVGYLRRFDSSGAEIWTREINGGLIEELTPAPDGGVHVAGVAIASLGDSGGPDGFSDAFVRRYDADGQVQWTEQFGSSRRDEADDVLPLTDGGFLVVGGTEYFLDGDGSGDWDGFVRRYDADRELVWQDVFDYSNSRERRDYPEAVTVAADGTIYVVGRSLAGTGGITSLAFVRRYNLDGALLSSELFGNQDWEPDEPRRNVGGESVISQPGRTLIGVGGIILRYGPGESKSVFSEVGGSITEHPGGGVYLAGWTREALFGPSAGGSDIYHALLGPAGRYAWTDQFGGEGNDYGGPVAVTEQGTFYLGGQGANEPGDGELFVRRYDS